MKQASRDTLVFHGFSLALRPRNLLPSDGSDVSPTLLPDDDITAPRNDIVTSASRVLRDVGLPETGATPTHLEVVQLVDVSTIPLFLFSPFTCTLYPQYSYVYTYTFVWQYYILRNQAKWHF